MKKPRKRRTSDADLRPEKRQFRRKILRRIEFLNVGDSPRFDSVFMRLWGESARIEGNSHRGGSMNTQESIDLIFRIIQEADPKCSAIKGLRYGSFAKAVSTFLQRGQTPTTDARGSGKIDMTRDTGRYHVYKIDPSIIKHVDTNDALGGPTSEKYEFSGWRIMGSRKRNTPKRTAEAQSRLTLELSTSGVIGEGCPLAYVGAYGQFFLIKETANPQEIQRTVRSLLRG